jgi:SAM-dependent methyltransferase
MIPSAKDRGLQAGASERVDWRHGYIFDTPPGPFDAATCLLTLHFVPDDGAKEQTLREIRRRLKPGAPFVLVDLCIDLAAPEAATALNRYRAFALESGGWLSAVNEKLTNMNPPDTLGAPHKGLFFFIFFGLPNEEDPGSFLRAGLGQPVHRRHGR